MNDVIFMNGGPGFRTLTTVILFLPLLAIVYKRKLWHYSFIAAVFCLTLTIFSSLFTSGRIKTSDDIIYIINILNSLVQPPLILMFLIYFSENEQMRKSLRLTVIILLVTGILILIRKDIQDAAIPVIIGLGLLLVDIFSIYFFIQKIKESVTAKTETGKAFMVSGIVFSYFCYSFIFIATYFFRSNNHEDLFVLYEISTAILALLIFAGILLNKNKPGLKEKTDDKKTAGIPEWEGFAASHRS
ncbi:hypothetical protein [Pollutibacter soli]|uniref:hypothetical protein n=1 Tax=Pollutibacter soli TaxID=3034157 RepID=UPI003013C8B3